jgi:hypothetical protein
MQGAGAAARRQSRVLHFCRHRYHDADDLACNDRARAAPPVATGARPRTGPPACRVRRRHRPKGAPQCGTCMYARPALAGHMHALRGVVQHAALKAGVATGAVTQCRGDSSGAGAVTVGALSQADLPQGAGRRGAGGRVPAQRHLGRVLHA